jgi:uncharacterized membrane protein YadS
MTFISSTKLAESLNDRADARLRSTVQRWPGRKTREILPGLFLNSITFAIRQLPGMATFSPMILSLIIGIVFHNIVGTAAWAKQGVTFSLRWLLRGAICLLGRQLTSSQVIAIGGRGLGTIAATLLVTFAFTEDVAYAIARVIVFGSVAMFAHPIPADGKAWIVAATTFLLSIALAATGSTNLRKLTAKGFRPALLGAFAFLFIAGFSLTLIKLRG